MTANQGWELGSCLKTRSRPRLKLTDAHPAPDAPPPVLRLPVAHPAAPSVDVEAYCLLYTHLIRAVIDVLLWFLYALGADFKPEVFNAGHD